MAITIQIQRLIAQSARRFSLSIQLRSQAKRIALFGPSGAGKSLTLQAVSGLLTPDNGKIQIGDQLFFCSETGVNLRPQQRQLAYLLQDYGLFPHLTVAQNISFALRKGWFNPAKMWLPKAAEQWVDAFELRPLLSSYPHEISGGQKQRTALARALVTRPSLLLLDEPLAALDLHLRVHMRKELAQLQQQLTIPSIIITHDPQDAIELADEVYLINQGRIQAQCSPDELKAKLKSA